MRIFEWVMYKNLNQEISLLRISLNLLHYIFLTIIIILTTHCHTHTYIHSHTPLDTNCKIQCKKYLHHSTWQNKQNMSHTVISTICLCVVNYSLLSSEICKKKITVPLTRLWSKWIIWIWTTTKNIYTKLLKTLWWNNHKSSKNGAKHANDIALHATEAIVFQLLVGYGRDGKDKFTGWLDKHRSHRRC